MFAPERESGGPRRRALTTGKLSGSPSSSANQSRTCAQPRWAAGLVTTTSLDAAGRPSEVASTTARRCWREVAKNTGAASG